VRQTYQKDVSEDEADSIALGTAGIQEKEQNRSAF
jgi:Asp/Glu/hydantoin racemase